MVCGTEQLAGFRFLPKLCEQWQTPFFQIVSSKQQPQNSNAWKALLPESWLEYFTSYNKIAIV